jgi:hypothetical protein
MKRPADFHFGQKAAITQSDDVLAMTANVAGADVLSKALSTKCCQLFADLHLHLLAAFMPITCKGMRFI